MRAPRITTHDVAPTGSKSARAACELQRYASLWRTAHVEH
jgi:hypothetical protein